MINTVLGPISSEQLGITLCHEHLLMDSNGADHQQPYDQAEAMATILPYLLEARSLGCQTMVEATTWGLGRNVALLAECAKRSGLNIITNTGIWDGKTTPFGKNVPNAMRSKGIEEIVQLWSSEFHDGIDGTSVRPGFIKLALGDTGEITPFQERLLRAAARTSRITGMPVQCHTIPAQAAARVVRILGDEGLPLQKLIMLHLDSERNVPFILELIQAGVWVEFDYDLSVTPDLSWHLQALGDLARQGMTHRLLLSHDAGWYAVGKPNSRSTTRAYTRIFTELIPMGRAAGLSEALFAQILVANPSLALRTE